MKDGQFKICGVMIKVKYANPSELSSLCMGRWDQMTSTITIRSDLPEDVRLSTLIHEVIHAIADMNDLGRIMDDETTVSVLANNLFAFLSDNLLTIRAPIE